MKYVKPFACIFIFSISILSCEEVFEPNLNSEKINLLTPSDSAISNNSSVVFSWDQKNGSPSYEIQVVRPRFDSNYQVLIDTTVRQSFYLGTLDSGVCQWRVRGFNSSSTTPFSLPRSLSVF
jgi:hypothetical protein